MKKVFIKYNPYKLETEITVDEKELAQNSLLREKSKSDSDSNSDPRLQEWVEELPELLLNEFNDTDFEILFHGTLLDYEDLTSVITDAQNKGKINSKCEHIPAKETPEKEALIDEVFKDIQEGPYDELRDEQIINAFKLAKSNDFEVCVVATMSAGKSTLINALLRQKLMPSKQEACTAIITYIKDNDNVPFRAKVYDKENKLTATYENLTLAIMERLNSDENVSEIKVEGKIPFVTSEDVSLVLIDTPGPNNARDEHHKEIQSKLLGKSSKALVLYIMTGEFGTDDDNILLKRVAESMSVGGKQSKDRFIFVVNKLEDRKKEDGDINQTLDRVRSYLKTHGVVNPNLFLAGALTALGIRMILNDVDIDDDDMIDDTETRVKRLNRNTNGQFHFEDYATLPASLRNEIKVKLNEVCSKYNGPQYENKEEALIHSGVVSIEAAIRQYVQKYAKTAKIKNIVDTFKYKLTELGCFEKTKRDLAKHQEEKERIVKQINSIRKKIDSAEEAKKFKDSVDDAVKKIDGDSKEVVERIIHEFQSLSSKQVDGIKDKKYVKSDAENEVEKLKNFTKELEPDFKVNLDDLITKNLVDTSNDLLNGYKNKLKSLTEEIDDKNLTAVKIEPIKWINMGMYNASSVKELVQEVSEKVQTRGWFKSLKFWPKSEWVTKEYVDGSELAREYLTQIEKSFSDNGDAARKYALEQSNRISDDFVDKFLQLDIILKSKLDELENYATNEKEAEKRIKESEKKLEWLEQRNAKIVSILEI